ncbi:MAG: trypsin-like peptidase domain-containing protein [Candidatus Zixiibacteriota bacterium]|nr:MAG: trypsin-like peptidase domain-containing protein [candidate division Zixibacteria bacterium]
MIKAAVISVTIALLYTTAFAGVAPSLQTDIFTARDRVLPALVHIQPVITDFRTGKMMKLSMIGSGVIFHPDGYVVTNYHVAGKAERIICTLFDNEQVRAELVGGDPMTDIAIIKLDLSEYRDSLTAAEFGDSDSIQVGQYVLAMGSPLALARSVSCGVISTVNRYFSAETRLPSGEKTGRYNTWIQTDAAINPGNSGGPLVDLNGKVVGVNSRATVFADNISFAIPINIVMQVSSEIINSGKVTRSWIGIQCQELQNLEGWFGTDRDEGVLIASIDAQSPAEEAGLQAGDIILRVNNRPVSARFAEQLPAFYKLIADYPVGSKIDLTVLRGDRQIYVDVITHELGEILGRDFECKDWGFTVKAITKQMAVNNQLEDTLGIFVSGVKRISGAFEGGLRRGDVVREINEIPTPRFQDFYDRYSELTSAMDEKVLLTVRRSGNTRYILIKVDITEATDTEK